MLDRHHQLTFSFLHDHYSVIAINAIFSNNSRNCSIHRWINAIFLTNLNGNGTRDMWVGDSLQRHARYAGALTHCSGTHGMRTRDSLQRHAWHAGALTHGKWNVIHYANNTNLTDRSCVPPPSSLGARGVWGVIHKSGMLEMSIINVIFLTNVEKCAIFVIISLLSRHKAKITVITAIVNSWFTYIPTYILTTLCCSQTIVTILPWTHKSTSMHCYEQQYQNLVGPFLKEPGLGCNQLLPGCN